MIYVDLCCISINILQQDYGLVYSIETHTYMNREGHYVLLIIYLLCKKTSIFKYARK